MLRYPSTMNKSSRCRRHRHKASITSGPGPESTGSSAQPVDIPCVFKLDIRKIVVGHRRKDGGGSMAPVNLASERCSSGTKVLRRREMNQPFDYVALTKSFSCIAVGRGTHSCSGTLAVWCDPTRQGDDCRPSQQDHHECPRPHSNYIVNMIRISVSVMSRAACEVNRCWGNGGAVVVRHSERFNDAMLMP